MRRRRARERPPVEGRREGLRKRAQPRCGASPVRPRGSRRRLSADLRARRGGERARLQLERFGLILDDEQEQAVALLALVAAQDVEPGERPGTCKIAQRTASDRVISVVDPDSCHARETNHTYRDGCCDHSDEDLRQRRTAHLWRRLWGNTSSTAPISPVAP